MSRPSRRSRRSASPSSRTPPSPPAPASPTAASRGPPPPPPAPRLPDGRRPGALSATLATFSFFPSKNLGAFGDGGAVTTHSPELAERIKTLRFPGPRAQRPFELVGHNSRLDALQAGILRVLLPHLDTWAD